MDLLPNDEQASISATAASLLDRVSPLGAVRDRTLAEDPTDPDVWSACADQGWFMLSLPEAAGGVGYGLTEDTLVLHEIGRRAVPGPFMSTIVGARLAARNNLTALTESLTSGARRVGLAIGPAEPVRSGSLRSFDGQDVDALLVVRPEDATLYDLDGASCQVNPSVDPAARIADWSNLGPALASCPSTDDDLWARVAVLTAAALSGVARAAAESSATYAQVRHQFGGPIGAFQAVKHRCADAAMRADAALHLTSLAALTIDADTASGRRLAASALQVAADHALRNAADDIQNHGGIGFTDEADPHLRLKRAHTLAIQMGPAATLRNLVLGR